MNTICFSRLDKTVSVLDIRVECQELERFSVINRFARFHIRGQGDTSGAASSSAMHKPVPQRYVTALPMPRNLPEGVQCFTLWSWFNWSSLKMNLVFIYSLHAISTRISPWSLSSLTLMLASKKDENAWRNAGQVNLVTEALSYFELRPSL